MFPERRRRRSLLVIGSFCPVAEIELHEVEMPCSSGLVPASSVVQMSGDSAGDKVVRWRSCLGCQTAEIRHRAAGDVVVEQGTSRPRQGPGRMTGRPEG